MKRSSGILLHISSLPCRYGIGQLGAPARAFVDFLSAARQSYWQVLPLTPTGYGDSPYQSCCAHAGSEYFIDLDILCGKGLLTAEEIEAQAAGASGRVDYSRLFTAVPPLLKTAFSRLDKSDGGFTEFLKRGEYASYALYRAVKASLGDRSWRKWPEEYRRADKKTLDAFISTHAEEILFWQWCQYEFFAQWDALKAYANSKGIKIIGDMPIYVAYDSVECWLDNKLVLLDENLDPTVVAGCPPDYFSEDGQLWGNPIYDWERMRKDGYAWWIKRLDKCFECFDVVRIDHFRGFDRYFAVPFGAQSAKEGEWRRGPSSAMFRAIESVRGRMPVIAEDLGILDDSARAMFAETGYPGMKILEYAFDNPDNDYLPHNYATDNCIVYPGTHDNDTVAGFISAMTEEQRSGFRRAVLDEYARLSLLAEADTVAGLADAVVRLGFESKAVLAITQMQDILGIGSEGRMNVPSTLSSDNWSYRIPEDYARPETVQKLLNLTEKTGRI